MRASATLVVGVVAVALTGCASGIRPDAQAARAHVAQAVEREEQKLRGKVVLASYRPVPDDKVLVTVKAGQEQPVGPVGAETADSSPDHAWTGSFGDMSFSAPANAYFSRVRKDPNEAGEALDKLRSWPFRQLNLNVDGRPVKARWTVRNRKLVLGVTIPL
jgi:hypothetical protein